MRNPRLRSQTLFLGCLTGLARDPLLAETPKLPTPSRSILRPLRHVIGCTNSAGVGCIAAHGRPPWPCPPAAAAAGAGSPPPPLLVPTSTAHVPCPTAVVEEGGAGGGITSRCMAEAEEEEREEEAAAGGMKVGQRSLCGNQAFPPVWPVDSLCLRLAVRGMQRRGAAATRSRGRASRTSSTRGGRRRMWAEAATMTGTAQAPPPTQVRQQR